MNTACFNTDVVLWQNKKDGFLRVTDDGSIVQRGEVLGRFESKESAEAALCAAGWGRAVSTAKDNAPLWVYQL